MRSCTVGAEIERVPADAFPLAQLEEIITVDSAVFLPAIENQTWCGIHLAPGEKLVMRATVVIELTGRER